MKTPRLCVVSLRYSSWSIRALVTLWHAGIEVEVEDVALDFKHQGMPESIGDQDAFVRDAWVELQRRRASGSVNGNFPVLWVDGTPIHEALSICEWTAEQKPEGKLWPVDSLSRARARSLSLEMASGFRNMRTFMSSHPFARVSGFTPDGPTRVEIARVLEIFGDALQASGGPFLFGDFGIVDAMYFPVLMRLETYGIAIPAEVQPYASALHALPATRRWRTEAAHAPRIPVYDAYIEKLGGRVL